MVRFPFLVSTRPTSKGYTISQSGVVFGSSKHATENRQKSVRFLQGGAELLYNEVSCTYEAVGNGLNGRRILIAGGLGSTGGAFIHNADNSNTYAVCASLANSLRDSAAMNENGQVAYVELSGTNKFYRIGELIGTSVVKSNLTAFAGASAAYIRAMNSSKVIVGERLSGGQYKAYVYNYPSNTIVEWIDGSLQFNDINNNGLVVGTISASAGCMASVQNNTLTVTNLNGCLDPSASGWVIEGAVAVNNHNVILAQARKSGYYTSPTYVLLTPSTYIPEPGAQIMVIQTGTVSGVNVGFTNVLSPGVFNRTYDASRDASYWNSQYAGLLAALDPSIPANTPLQMWNLSFSGSFGGAAQVTLYYNHNALPGPEANLTILHYNSNTLAWEPIAGTVVDSVNHTITFSTTSFSPFILSASAPSSHTITSSAGPNGSISPTGAVSVASGANQTFVIQANPLCRINDILTNSASIAYPFDNNHTNFNFCWSNIQASGTIQATFTTRLSASGTPHPWLHDFYPESNDLSQVATLDTDNDRLTADQEYIAGTDPTNGNSRFFISGVTISNNTVLLTAHPAISNRNYQLLCSTNLDTDFSPVTNNLTTEAGTLKVTATNESPASFFQLKVSLP